MSMTITILAKNFDFCSSWIPRTRGKKIWLRVHVTAEVTTCSSVVVVSERKAECFGFESQLFILSVIIVSTVFRFNNFSLFLFLFIAESVR